MRTIVRISFICLCFCGLISAQKYETKLEKIKNYNSWGADWDSIYVVKNDLVTVAVLPKVGGRVMQYDLGTHPSMYIHEESKGKVPTDGNTIIGGFRTLPSPQSDFTWPSPPKLDWNPYTCTVISNSTDSIVLYLESQVENNEKNEDKYKTHKGLQFKRLLTFYKASSRVKVELTMLNKGSSTMKHGIWDITQSTCMNKGAIDKENIRVYFQRNPSSTLGNGKGYVRYESEGSDQTQWKADAAPGGIMGVHYMAKTGKIGADCKAGWICFVDQLDGYAYVKTFNYETAKEYPDSGASVQVYTYTDYGMLEVEVLGPLTTLNAGDSVKMVENWYATRASGPVLAVNNAGLITKRLEPQQTDDSMSVKGTYGLFYPGYVLCKFVKNDGESVSVADSFSVNPLDSLKFSKKYRVPAGATKFQLAAFDKSGKLLGILDTAMVPDPVGVNMQQNRSVSFSMRKVNITHNNRSVLINVLSEGSFTVSMFNLEGKLLSKVRGNTSINNTVSLSANSANAFIVRVNGCGWTESRIFSVPE